MGSTKKYWKGLEELHENPEFVKAAQSEFPEELPVDEFLADSKLGETSTGRRDFLKFLGFSVTAATLAACEAPVVKSIPYVNKPEEVTPGVANWYASTYYDGNDYASVLVKTREGRPIFIKGNKIGFTNGAVNARINSSVLSLYDSQRVQEPMKGGAVASWAGVDADIMAALEKHKGGNVTILTNTIISPSTQRAIDELSAKMGGSIVSNEEMPADTLGGIMEMEMPAPSEGGINHIQYDAISNSGIRKANKSSFGQEVIPNYDFSKAEVIVSIGADFLAHWLMSMEYVGQYAQNRRPENGKMSRHFQFESIMSLTGSNADIRRAIKPSEEGAVAISLHNHIAKAKGGTTISGGQLEGHVEEAVAMAAKELLACNGSLVVAGSNSPAVQTVVNNINAMLGNYGKSIDLNNPVNIKQSNDEGVEQLVKDMNAGKVDVLIVYGVNPVYSLPNGDEFAAGLSKVKTSVAISLYADETASKATYLCPDNHYLESWNDYNPKAGSYGLAQPAISKLFNTRQGQESLLAWAGNSTSYHAYIQETWQQTVLGAGGLFTDSWNKSLHNGSYEMPKATTGGATFNGDVSGAASEIAKMAGAMSGTEVVVYQKAGMGDGMNTTGNPWLQELPDPISKVTWDNYITMSPADVLELYGMEVNDDNKRTALYIGEQNPTKQATVTVNGKSLTLPVYPSPGQKRGTIGIALGYGRSAKVGKAAYEYGEYGDPVTDENGNHKSIGANAYPFTSFTGGNIMYCAGASVTLVDEVYYIATTQTHHTIMGRDSVLRETTLGVYNEHNAANTYNPPHTLKYHENGTTVDKPISEIDLWEAHPVENVGHRWGLSVDLNTCIGCGACVTACVAENNVPVVGKDEVRRAREMHWMRIDRYYSSDASIDEDGYLAAEVPSENPEVAFVPMMCQHCNHAPCETVCPVAATTHSNEGLNMMAYNRCIGTRYCANNCPFKVRRFNWFNYMGYRKFSDINPAQDELGRMVLNPDVVVRARGVMEKCSLCVQSIQAGKLEAKKAGRKIKDGEIQTACSAGCPTNAITFGDLNDNDMTIAEHADDERAYNMLQEVGVQPNIYYMAKVRNKKEVKKKVMPEGEATETTEENA